MWVSFKHSNLYCRRHNIYISNSARVDDIKSLGDNVSISELCYVKKGCVIGDNSYLNRGTILISGLIGKYCSIGFNCQIGQYEHPLDFVTTSERIYHNCDNNVLKSYREINDPPKIGNDVWIGSNAMIMQGVQIGDGSVIAGGDCPKTKFGADQTTRYRRANASESQYVVDDSSENGVFGQSGGVLSQKTYHLMLS